MHEVEVGTRLAGQCLMRPALSFLLSVLLAAGAVELTACTRPVTVHNASLPTAPFAKYRTFSFGDPEGSPQGYKVSPRSAEVQRRLKPIITAVFQEKGYSLATGKGDFVIAYGSGRRDAAILHRARSHDGMEEDEEDDFVEGSIVLDVFDGLNDGQVWHGATLAGINPEHVDPVQLERSVKLLLARYPSATIHATEGMVTPPPRPTT
jgi:hypothetical protein